MARIRLHPDYRVRKPTCRDLHPRQTRRSLKECARILGITRQRVNQLEFKALRHFLEAIERDEVLLRIARQHRIR